MRNFETWWRDEGSAMRPMPGEDEEEHAKRIARIAWSNGAYCALRDKTQLQETITTNLSQRDA